METKTKCWRCSGRGTLFWCDSAIRGAPMGQCFTEVCDTCGGTQFLPYSKTAPNPGYDFVLSVGGKQHADSSLDDAIRSILRNNRQAR